MLVWSSNLVDFQALIQTNFLQNRSLKIYFPLVTGHPVHMYIAEVYLLHCSSNLVAPSSPPRASTMYPVCISLSLFLSSSLSAFHVHAHGFISLSLSPPRSAPYISVSLPYIPLHPATAIPIPIPLFTPHQRPKMDSLPGPGMVFEKFCSHAATHANTHHTRDRTVYAYLRSARAQPHTHTHTYTWQVLRW